MAATHGDSTSGIVGSAVLEGERQERQSDLPIRIPVGVQDEVVALTVLAGSGCSLVGGMVLDLFGRLTYDIGGLPATDEQDRGCLGIAPSEISQELSKSIPDCLGSPPDLALGDENIAVFRSDEDVCLACALNTSPAAAPSNCAFREMRSRSQIFSSSRYAVIDWERSSALRAFRSTARACSYLGFGQHRFRLIRAARRWPGRADLPPRARNCVLGGVGSLPDRESEICLQLPVGQKPCLPLSEVIADLSANGRVVPLNVAARP